MSKVNHAVSRHLKLYKIMRSKYRELYKSYDRLHDEYIDLKGDLAEANAINKYLYAELDNQKDKLNKSQERVRRFYNE